ncbi:MAG: 3-oxoacyl-ACP synthase III family protein [Bacteroidetes bacterium]|nr:3-oxoacyl-ACP synthase III family protein [Bacteroidota bacterium]
MKTQENMGISNITITGSSAAFPQTGQWMHNRDIHALIFGSAWQEKMQEKKLDPDYYEKVLGFENRFWVHTPGMPILHTELTSADLMLEAAERAIEDSGIAKNEIDFIITVTITSPRYSTSMGPYIAGRLGINAPAIEMKTGCASNIFSIVLSSQIIAGGARNVLITCGETITKILKLNPRMAYAGGDAGAAVVISKSSDPAKGILASYINSNGSFSGHMGVPGLLPPNQFDLEHENYFMEYSDTAEDFLNQAWSEIPEILYKKAGIASQDIDCLIPHQVNKNRTAFAANAANISLEKTVNIIGKIANCGSAGVLLALDDARKNKACKKDKTIMLLSAGGGISWGGLIIKT